MWGTAASGTIPGQANGVVDVPVKVEWRELFGGTVNKHPSSVLIISYFAFLCFASTGMSGIAAIVLMVPVLVMLE